MAQRLRAAVYGIMLCACVGLEITVVITLHSQYCLNSQYGVEVRVFSASFLTTSPAWVTEDVHIRTPECKLRITRVIDHSHRYIEDVVIGTVPVGAGLV